MKDKTDVLATIKDIHEQCKKRFGYVPQRVGVNGLMRARIVREICLINDLEYAATRREAVQGMSILGMQFWIDNRIPDDELHFCTKQRNLMVRVKVDQQPMDGSLNQAAYTPAQAEGRRSHPPSFADNASLSAQEAASAQIVPIGTAS